jgi:hypothetical protein
MVRNIDGMDALVQAVKKCLQTERYSEEIYSTGYGVEIERMIGRSGGYVRSALPKTIKDALMQDDRITSVVVRDIVTTVETISFTIDVRAHGVDVSIPLRGGG